MVLLESSDGGVLRIPFGIPWMEGKRWRRDRNDTKIVTLDIDREIDK